MKKYFLITAICFAGLYSIETNAQSPTINYFVRQVKHSGMKKHSEWYDFTVPGFLVKLGALFIKKEDLAGVNIRPFIRKIRKIRVVHGEGVMNIQKGLFNNFIEKIKRENYEQLLTVKEKSEHVNIFSRERKGCIRDILIVVVENDEFSLINLKGKFSQEIITGLVNSAIEHENFTARR